MASGRDGVKDGQGARVLLSRRRVVAFSVLSGGLYFLYWVFRTWKQLAGETPGRFYPVWHALAQLVPVYAQFRLHRHTDLIRRLAAEASQPPRLSPLGVVTLVVVGAGAGLLSMGTASPLVVLLLVVANVLFTTAAILWPQETLNRYWRATLGARAAEAPVAPAEVLLALAGALAWSLPLTLL